jgi:hypothetical protein
LEGFTAGLRETAKLFLLRSDRNAASRSSETTLAVVNVLVGTGVLLTGLHSSFEIFGTKFTAGILFAGVRLISAAVVELREMAG